MKKWLLMLLLAVIAGPAAAVDLPNNSAGNSRTAVAPSGLFRWNETNWVPVQAEDFDPGLGYDLKYLAAGQWKLYANGASSNPQGGYVDSTTALDTRGWTHKTLGFYATVKDSLSPVFALFAISVRGHYVQASDSLSTLAYWPIGSAVGNAAAAGAAGGVVDTLGTGQSDSNELTALASTALPYEILVPIYPSTSSPRGRAYDLAQWFGTLAMPYTSVRVRLLGVFNASGTNVIGNATVRVDLVGAR
jgi:hypothetical protein